MIVRGTNSDELVYLNVTRCDVHLQVITGCSDINGPGHAKMCFMAYANNKGADQPAHPRSLIRTYVVRRLDSMNCLLALSKVSRF